MSDNEKKPLIFPLVREKWKSLSPAERLEHAKQLHKQMVEALLAEQDSTEQIEE
jgi:hypothetical protein